MRYRPHKPVSPVRVVISTLVGLLLGSSLAVVLLLAKPVSKVQTIPEEEKGRQIGQTVVYYAPGMASINRSALFDRNYNRIMRRQPGTYELLEGDLNAYLKGLVPTAPRGEDGKAPGVSIDAPNVKITEGGIVFSLAMTVSPGTQQAREMVVQLRGTFEEGASGPRLQVTGMSINSLRVPSFMSQNFKMQQTGSLPPELMEAWANIEWIDLQPGKMLVRVKPS